jgi:hypothetical protein
MIGSTRFGDQAAGCALLMSQLGFQEVLRDLCLLFRRTIRNPSVPGPAPAEFQPETQNG